MRRNGHLSVVMSMLMAMSMASALCIPFSGYHRESALSLTTYLMNDDPCDGCWFVVNHRISDIQEYVCMIDIVSCPNLQCDVSDLCIPVPRSYPVVQQIQNVYGDPDCQCSLIPSTYRCGSSSIDGTYTVYPGGIVPPCTRLYIFIDLIGTEQYHYITILCPNEDGGVEERVIINRSTRCPISHRFRYLYQAEEGCCPEWIPVLPVSP